MTLPGNLRGLLNSLGGSHYTDGDLDAGGYPAYGKGIEPNSVFNPSEIFIKNPAWFVLGGLGEYGEICGSRFITHFDRDPTAGRIKTSVHRCRRFACPRCYKDWIVERTFESAVLVEAFARYTGERPSMVQASVHPDDAKDWTWSDFNYRLHRRGLRHVKKMGAVAGLRYFHPFRVADLVKAGLKAKGYGTGDRGYWTGIREDVLELGDWRKYTIYGPHDHFLVFPSFLEKHSNRDFVVKKYAVLQDVKAVVGHLRYLLSHTGKVDDTGDQPTSRFGLFAGRDPWRPEDHLAPEVLDDLKAEIAGMLGRKWDPIDGLVYVTDQDDEGIEWFPIYELSHYFANLDWREALEPSARKGFNTLIDCLKSEDPRALRWDENAGLENLLLCYHYPPLTDAEESGEPPPLEETEWTNQT